MKLLILTGLFFVSLNSLAQVVGPDGRMWLESREGLPIEMQAGTTVVKMDGHVLPDHPAGLRWVVVSYTSSGNEIYKLVAENDTRVTESDNYELLMYVDNFRQPMEEYTRAQRTKFIFEGLVEAGFPKAKAKTLANKLTDSRNKSIESDVIINGRRPSACQKALS